MRKLLMRVSGLFALMLLLASCDTNRVFEENQDLPENQWPVNLAPVYTFEITDTTQRFNVYFNVRNAVHYPFYNLYLRHYLTAPNGELLNSYLHEMYLMDPKTGEPLGSGAGDIFDHQFRALKNVTFRQAGTYRLKLNQYMRQDPLPGIMSVGVRVEKVAQ
ncbi:gliding motility lipoprotein GldH [Rufibacter ruber]|uniref:gliding motility lipoprotein GldH n=1 Tax=Rufibacter ruber TaxID=1783499 RepID=UPI000832CCAA|nr:gliding motility lipoprotein GldH [Rufibacter ruber]